MHGPFLISQAVFLWMLPAAQSFNWMLFGVSHPWGLTCLLSLKHTVLASGQLTDLGWVNFGFDLLVQVVLLVYSIHAFSAFCRWKSTVSTLWPKESSSHNVYANHLSPDSQAWPSAGHWTCGDSVLVGPGDTYCLPPVGGYLPSPKQEELKTSLSLIRLRS